MTTRRLHRPLAALVCGMFLWVGPSGKAQEWTRFRGPNGTGISLAKGIPSKFTLADANWRVALKGEGHSSPVLWGDRVFVTGSDARKESFIVQCLKVADGLEVWSMTRPQKPYRIHKFNHLASSSPATDGKRLVVLVSEPGAHTVFALDMDGKKLWERTFETIISNHGSGVSPIFHGDKVVLAGMRRTKVFWRHLMLPAGMCCGRPTGPTSRRPSRRRAVSWILPAPRDFCSTAWLTALRSWTQAPAKRFGNRVVCSTSER